MRLIDADALIEKFEKLKEGGNLQDIIFLDGAQAVVDAMPTVKDEDGQETVYPTEIFITVGEKAYKDFTGKEPEGLGGMNVYPNQYSSGVCIMHVPTGKMAYCNSERSQFKNKERALAELAKIVGKIR